MSLGSYLKNPVKALRKMFGLDKPEIVRQDPKGMADKALNNSTALANMGLAESNRTDSNTNVALTALGSQATSVPTPTPQGKGAVYKRAANLLGGR
jgi:hypothetical protein